MGASNGKLTKNEIKKISNETKCKFFLLFQLSSVLIAVKLKLKIKSPKWKSNNGTAAL